MVALPAPSRFDASEAASSWAPGQARVHVDRANRFFTAGMLEAALDEDVKASKLAQHDALVRNNLGVTLAKLGRWEDALDEFQRAVELEPHHPTTLRNMAYALWELNRRREAISTLDKSNHPLVKEAKRTLGDIHLRELAKKGAIYWAGGKPHGSSLNVGLTPGPRLSQWIIESRR